MAFKGLNTELYDHQGTQCSLWQVGEHLDCETWGVVAVG